MPSQIRMTTADLIVQHGIIGSACKIVSDKITVEGEVSGYVHISQQNNLPNTPLGHTITLRKLTYRSKEVPEKAEWRGGDSFVVQPETHWERVGDEYVIQLPGFSIRLLLPQMKLPIAA